MTYPFIHKGVFVLSLLICFPLAPTAMRAQNPGGTLRGVVQDVSGARIPSARISAYAPGTSLERQTTSDGQGEFRIENLLPGNYNVVVNAQGFTEARSDVAIVVSTVREITVTMKPGPVQQTVSVLGQASSITTHSIEMTSSVEKTVISGKDLETLPLGSRSFANIAYMTAMVLPVEPSDPTKARITAVSFGGSSGLNVDLSVDGGDNNDDWIGGFLQNYSVDSIQEFAVRTAQFDADTSRSNGGSVIISTRHGGNDWHGGAGVYLRASAFNARNILDNPEPNPKQPFSRVNSVGTLGGPMVKDKLWFFTSYENVHENASVAYSALSLSEFHALAQLASLGLITRASGVSVPSIAVPSSAPVPFREHLFTTRVDWAQSARSQWFFRVSLDRNNTANNLLQQGTLPSTGAYTVSNYWSALLSQQFQFSGDCVGVLTLQANRLHLTQDPNSKLGLGLAFPFSQTFLTTSGQETFGDNQFATSITAFPIERDQQKYQYRYDLRFSRGKHAAAFGINFIHEPVLRGRLLDSAETLAKFPKDPSFYVANPAMFVPDFLANSTATPAGDGRFSQSVKRLGFYAQDSWRLHPGFTVNYGVRYDTTSGLFKAFGRNQDQNGALVQLRALGINLVPGVPHDYRGAVSPRLGIAYAPGSSNKNVLRAGIGLYYNDLAQNGWSQALQSVNNRNTGVQPGAGGQGFLIDSRYHSPYAIQVSAGVEHEISDAWQMDIHYEHQQGVHQYRRYEYAAGVTLPAAAPSISLFRTDNRSQYDGVSFTVQHSFSHHFEMEAHYTLAKATTWGAVIGELFDYVNGVSDVRHAFGPGDHGPSGEDVRHRFVLAGTVQLPGKIELSTLAQFESARPYTMFTPLDVNNDGIKTNDRAVINGVQTSLDQFRGTPYSQVDLRVSREFKHKERWAVRPFAEFFNLFNRSNPGNNFLPDISAQPIPVNNLSNATAFCLNAGCTQTRPITSPNQLRIPAGAVGDFFGPGTTVGIPFAAQLGVRVSF
jgi:hypothetical protein